MPFLKEKWSLDITYLLFWLSFILSFSSYSMSKWKGCLFSSFFWKTWAIKVFLKCLSWWHWYFCFWYVTNVIIPLNNYRILNHILIRFTVVYICILVVTTLMDKKAQPWGNNFLKKYTFSTKNSLRRLLVAPGCILCLDFTCCFLKTCCVLSWRNAYGSVGQTFLRWSWWSNDLLSLFPSLLGFPIALTLLDHISKYISCRWWHTALLPK